MTNAPDRGICIIWFSSEVQDLFILVLDPGHYHRVGLFLERVAVAHPEAVTSLREDMDLDIGSYAQGSLIEIKGLLHRDCFIVRTEEEHYRRHVLADIIL